MTLNHSKTWPVSTLAVVQLRVDSNGRTYSTQLDVDDELPNDGLRAADDERVANSKRNGLMVEAPDAHRNGGVVACTLPLSQRHVELFTVQQQEEQRLTPPTPHATSAQRHHACRTDTVSTLVEQDNDFDSITSIPHEGVVDSKANHLSKFRVLALAKIDEAQHQEVVVAQRGAPTVRVENWDHLVYNAPARNPPNGGGDGGGAGRKPCPACTAAAMAAYKGRNSPSAAAAADHNDRLLMDLPLDARKATTLRRHYYPEGGWGWVIITCAVLVHVLNVGLQLSCSQLAPSGAHKFKTSHVHIADKQPEGEQHTPKTIRVTVVGDGNTGKTCLLISYKDKVYSDVYIPTVFDSYSLNIPIYDQTYRLILQDTAGQEDYDKLRPLGYTETNAFIICYAVDRVESYANVRNKWSKEVRHYRPNAKIILVGTKVDMRTVAHSEALLTFADGVTMQRRIRADDFYECSAKQLYNVEQVFGAALMACVQRPNAQRQRPCVLL